MIDWRGKWQPTSVFLTGEHHEQYEKATRYNMTPEDEPLGWENVQYATGEQWRTITNTLERIKL